MKTKLLTTKNMAVMAMLGAMAGVLMYLEIALPFAPVFYKLDFCEVPTLIGTFALGPMAGVIISIIKILVSLVLKGTSTGGVGEIANLLSCIMWTVPAGLIYKRMKSRKGAVIGLIVGGITMILGSCFANAFITIPFYAKVMFDGVDQIIAMGTAVNANITGMGSFILLAVVPFNVVKTTAVSVLTFLLYKKVSKFIHNIGNHDSKEDVKKAAKQLAEAKDAE